MGIKLEVTITEERTIIEANDFQLQIELSNGQENLLEQVLIYFLVKEKQIIAIGDGIKDKQIPAVEFDQVIRISPSSEFELQYLAQSLLNTANENDLKIDSYLSNSGAIPKNMSRTIKDYQKVLLDILRTFGYSLEATKVPTAAKAKTGKTQYRWSKDISQMEFSVDFRGGKGQVVWQKRNQMLLKAGAVLLPVAPLNKDGSVGFAAKMGEKIRSEQSDKIKNFVTTEDIILKSVNEIGLFLYFAGTNSWLELLDKDGKSLYEWAKIE